MPDEIYTTSAGGATLALRDLLRRRIAAAGPLGFPEFMACALYHPEWGYYARTTRQVGREGDFFTSVSVGPVFGGMLARRFRDGWQEAGSPPRWRLIESGAHDGTLAADILTALGGLDAAALAGLEYVIPEPLPLLRAAQHERLRQFGRRVRHVVDPAELAAEPLPGIAFGNEVLDALPVHVVEWRQGRWHACNVGCGTDGGFCWVPGELPAEPALVAALAVLGPGFPEGYRTEVCTAHAAFLRPLLGALSRGRLLWFDYGMARPDYYHPARTAGTLRTFSRHRAAADPLQAPGGLDLTAHVDFTAVAETCLALGCRLMAFRTQAAWLTTVARPWLLAMEGQPDARLLRQFQTLTHPAHLGTRFHVLEVAWNDPQAPAAGAADWHRLALPPVAQTAGK
jgi:SAM-dependent MidA family methyltransferase